MAFVPIIGTGFEAGAIPKSPDIVTSNMTCGAGGVTGAYHVTYTGVGDAYVTMAFSAVDTELYVAAWVKPRTSATFSAVIVATMSDGNYLAVRHDGNYWDAYVNTTKVADGTIATGVGAYQHIQGRFVIGDGTSGSIFWKCAGNDDVGYCGDTKPGTATTFTSFSVKTVNTYSDGFDNIICGTGGWPGDFRFERILVNGDSTPMEWSCSSGSVGYTLLDDATPNTTDYISSGSNGQKAMFDLASWSGTGKTAKIVNVMAYAFKDDATGISLKTIDYDGVTERKSAAKVISTSAFHYFDSLTTSSSGSAWDNTIIDALEIGVENVM